MASKYDWDFIRPLDQTANLAALSQGNQQIQQGIQGMGNAVTGFADAMKQRNTDQILNALMGAQTSGDLPQTMQAVEALQQQFGRGYDQNAVRNAIDTRGSTLAQRDLQGINLQQAQAAQAAIPQLNQAAIAQAKARGVDTSAMEALANLGIDTTGQINQFAGNAVSDARDTRDFDYRKGIDERNYNRQVERDRVGDAQWAEGNNRANLQSAYSMSEGLTPQAQSGYSVDANGNFVTVNQAGGSRIDTMSALMDNLFMTESRNTHRQADGSLTRSPKGALGVAQIMPATAAKPGYGMKPINLQTSSPEQQKAWATEYIDKIASKHGFTTEQAVAAYNAGPGAVQDAIKKGGNNWLSQLPKETQNYVPKVMGGSQRRGSAATQALGPQVSQANMSKVTSGYQDAMAKLETDFSVNQAKSQTKGSLATTGKNVDTWVAGKKDGGLLFANNDTFFTKAGDLAKMAKADPAFNKLPESAQMNVLEGAYAKMNDVNAFQYVPDGDLKKFISRESTNYQKNLVDQHKQAKNAVFEQSYQNLVQQFQAVGSKPPSREAARQLFDPTYKPKQQEAPKAKPVSQAKQATKAVAPKAAVKQDERLDNYLAKRNAERAQRGSQPTKPAAKPATTKVATTAMASNLKKLPSGTMSQAEIDDLMKKYKVR